MEDFNHSPETGDLHHQQPESARGPTQSVDERLDQLLAEAAAADAEQDLRDVERLRRRVEAIFDAVRQDDGSEPDV